MINIRFTDIRQVKGVALLKLLTNGCNKYVSINANTNGPSNDWNRANKAAMEIQLWQLFIKAWNDMVVGCKAKGKRYILIGHEKMDKDEIDGGHKRMLNLPSQAQVLVPSLFPDVWEVYVEQKMQAGKAQHNHRVRCKTENRVNSLKASHPDAPAVFEADWETVKKYLIRWLIKYP